MSAVVTEQIGRQCAGADCARTVTLKYGRYCDPCRSRARRKRKLYVSNDFIDAQIRRAYIERADKRLSPIPNLKQIARRVGWPAWAIKKRGRELGLARTKDRPWGEEELAVLERYAWMCPARIRLKLKAAGFQRTETAIDVKLDRTVARRNTPYFTANALSLLLGIDRHTVGRWIKLGYLKARMRGTERHEGNGGDMYMIHENDFRAFVYARPTEIDLRKVDQLWFLDFITEGRIAGA